MRAAGRASGGASLRLVDFVRGETLHRVHQFAERPELRLTLGSLRLRPRLQKEVNVIGHYDSGEEFVSRAFEMLECVEDDGACVWRKDAASVVT